MCEFNRPYPVPFGQHPDDNLRPLALVVQPPEAWQQRSVELPHEEAAVINNAVLEAAVLRADVHLYRKVGSQFLGLSLEPGSGPNVKIWEH